MNIVILGMHRSGTSLVAGILENMGYHIGYNEELIRGGEENPKGFFERKDFRDINDTVLQENNFDWYKVADYSIESIDGNSRKKYQLSAKLIISALDARGKWAIKEPRFCLLYPFLKELTNSAIKLVVYREPIESAESLWRRNDFPMCYGLALWEKYYNVLFGSLASDNLLVISYNNLLLDPECEINALIEGIKRISGNSSNIANVNSAISFVNKKYYRSKLYTKLKKDYLTNSQKLLFEQLCKFEIGGNLEQVSGQFNDAVLKQNQCFFGASGLIEKNIRLIQAEKQNKVLISKYEKELKNVKGKIIKQKSEIIKQKSEIIKLKSTLSWKLTSPLRYLSAKTPRLSKAINILLRGSYRAVKQKVVQSRVKIEKHDWGAPSDIGKKIVHYKKNVSEAQRKVVVYTALYDGYDTLMLPDYLETDIDYVCFTDGPINSFGVWKIRSAPYYHPDSTRIARYVKTHPHELLANYDVVVWIDSNIVMRGDVWRYIKILKENEADIGFVTHPLRDCVYDEAKACKDLKKDQYEVIDKQIERYQQKKYPPNSGMYETNFFVASLNAPNIQTFFRNWWKEIDLYSKRDQLSIGWTLSDSKISKTPLMPNGISVRNNVDFTIYPHEIARLLSAPKWLKEFTFIQEPETGVRFSDVRDLRLTAIKNVSIDIVICVYNALEDVKLCLSSVIDHITDNESIILVNDVSNDETTEYLRKFTENNDRVTLVENEHNLGYTRSANRGLKLCKSDLRIMLNSDTIVSKNWAQKMADVAYSSEAIGIVGPLSNAASSQSIPEIKGTRGQTAINKLPKDIKITDIDLACEKWASANLFPRVPLIHGFCFGIKNSVIDRIGYFDDVNFKRYYGEENDYCFRARSAGFELAIATNTFVYHRKSRSIEEEDRLIYMDEAGKRLRELYGAKNVSLACQQMVDHPLLVQLRDRATQYFNA